MRKVISTIFFLPSLVFLLVGSNPIQTQKEYVPNEVLVKFKRDISVYSIKEAITYVQGKIITYRRVEIEPFVWESSDPSQRSFRLDPDLFHIKVPETVGTEQAISTLSKDPNVKYAEKNFIYHIDRSPYDPYFTEQWGLHNTGQGGGTTDADIDAPEAWDIFTGTPGVVVAVIDTGVDYNHEDLSDNMWINLIEYEGTPGVDDDYPPNGYIDDIYGYNFLYRQYMPPEKRNPLDDVGHGTHVAGIIGAVGNNGKGVTGVNWNVQIMALKIFDASGGGATDDIIHAIDYAIEKNATLSNNSWGGSEYSAPLRDAIERAKNAGQLFICSAGNDSRDIDEQGNQYYPACYDLGNIICVASTTNNDELSDFSNWGHISADLGAPGGYGKGQSPNEDDIYSTLPNNSYGFQKGTSMATPYVSGAAALLLGYYSGLEYWQVKNAIIASVDKLASLSEKCVSEGRLNAHKALVIPISPSNLNAWPTAWTEIDLSWQDNSVNEQGFKIERKRADENNFSEIATLGNNITSYKDETVSAGVDYDYRIKAYNQYGESSPSDTDSAKVPTNTPDAPSHIEAHFLWSTHQVELAWSDSSNNEQGFAIERRSEYEPSWQEIDRVGANETMYYDSNVDPDTFYYYRVRAYNPSGYSPYSSVATIYVPWY